MIEPVRTVTKTVLITGASSGIGRAAVLKFQQQGWTTIATMRSLEKAGELAALAKVHCLALDVTNQASIQTAVSQALDSVGQIDVLVNNAGYGLMGAFEACTPEQIQRQFDTNVFGLMNVTRSLLPHFRDRRSGTIVNVSSIAGKLAFPLYSLYHSTKWAVEGFSESLQYELEPFNIRVKIIEPGPIKTDFYSRSADLSHRPGLTAYDAFVAKVLPNMSRAGETGGTPETVADIIYQAATDQSSRLRYPAGGNAGTLLLLRKLLSDRAFSSLVRKIVVR
ncbi:SDR family NAD(P)-dependent oxidoreductase [Myxacorys almedinensis A]|uniref:SDR family NAD(P)-dependent oxidoreductase n=2 Tax=Myxacorys TaxID=2056239 RepID=A0A8J7Z1D5_9CYAN|nr:SDR family NAD(P)-dependent oxidoreductase [Myxacorys almedinensis A]